MRFHSTIEMQILWLKHSILKAFESVNTEQIDFFSILHFNEVIFLIKTLL